MQIYRQTARQLQTYRQTASQMRADLGTVHAQSQMMMGAGRGGLGGAIGVGLGGATRMAGGHGGHDRR